MRALCSQILDELQAKYGRVDELDEEQRNRIIKDERYFAFDINSLCRRIGLTPSQPNKDTVRKMIARLRDTAFLIDASNSELFRLKYNLNAEVANYRIITEFKAKLETEHSVETGRNVRRERFYLIKFDETIMRNLVSKGRSFISHEQLISDKSGLAHRINDWCKAVIGVRPRLGNPEHKYTLEQFHERVLPSAIITNFRRDLIALLQRQCERHYDRETGLIDRIEATDWYGEAQPSTAWLYGYYITIEWNPKEYERLSRLRGNRLNAHKPPIVITVKRDVEDELVGNNSLHNQAVRRQIALLHQQGLIDSYYGYDEGADEE
jgi:hypothetical protein